MEPSQLDRKATQSTLAEKSYDKYLRYVSVFLSNLVNEVVSFTKINLEGTVILLTLLGINLTCSFYIHKT